MKKKILQSEKIFIKLTLKYAKIEVFCENNNAGLKFSFKKVQNSKNFNSS